MRCSSRSAIQRVPCGARLCARTRHRRSARSTGAATRAHRDPGFVPATRHAKVESSSYSSSVPPGGARPVPCAAAARVARPRRRDSCRRWDHCSPSQTQVYCAEGSSGFSPAFPLSEPSLTIDTCAANDPGSNNATRQDAKGGRASASGWQERGSKRRPARRRPPPTIGCPFLLPARRL